MGDPAMYPEIRTARSIYALQRLPRDFTADVDARKQWVDNNLTYLDGLVLADLHYHDADFRRDSCLVHIPQPPYVPPRRVPPMAMVPRCVWPFHSHSRLRYDRVPFLAPPEAMTPKAQEGPPARNSGEWGGGVPRPFPRARSPSP
eukprot:scaffold24170_cov102-Isochrysis_galbana.AAC.1